MREKGREGGREGSGLWLGRGFLTRQLWKMGHFLHKLRVFLADPMVELLQLHLHSDKHHITLTQGEKTDHPLTSNNVGPYVQTPPTPTQPTDHLHVSYTVNSTASGNICLIKASYGTVCGWGLWSRITIMDHLIIITLLTNRYDKQGYKPL